jgi:hypothetical protein
MQMIEYAARHLLPEDQRHLKPEELYEALVDHDVPGDRHGYMDRNTLRGREILSGIAADLAWRMLTTEDGARRIRDGAR